MYVTSIIIPVLKREVRGIRCIVSGLCFFLAFQDMMQELCMYAGAHTQIYVTHAFILIN